MKVGVIGLGSMGQRRVRNLQALGIRDIIGVETRSDRREHVESTLSISTVGSLKEIPKTDAIVISTPPMQHVSDLIWSLGRRLPSFVELNVVSKNLSKADKLSRSSRTLVAPSSTFLFHPAIRFISDTISSNTHGRVTNFSYHVGHYLPDWHPWERPQEFFVGKKETSGCRELLAFELNWISHLLGLPKELTILSRKALGFGMPFEDVYGAQLGFRQSIGTLTIDVVSRFGTRSLILNFEKAQLRWSWEIPEVRIYEAERKAWHTYSFPRPSATEGYNQNISEGMYVDELKAFLAAVQGGAKFPSKLADDIAVLTLIEKALSKKGNGR